MKTRPFLILQHADDSPPGLIGDYLRDAGFGLDVRRLHCGDGVPERLDDHAALIVLGGDMNPGEDEQFHFLLDERRLFEATLADDLPVLGVCLGAELLAVAAGGDVVPRASLEVGWYPIGMTQPDALLVGVHPRRDLVFLWHSYLCQVPQDGVVVAMRDGEPQVFRIGEHAWGVQFHPEITREIVMAWLDDGSGEADEAWPQGLKHLKKATKRELYRSALTCGQLMMNFLTASGARARATGAG